MIASLHIGGDLILNSAEIIGIFSDPGANSAFIDPYKTKFRLKNMSEKNRSFILVKGGAGSLVYYSKISAGKMINRLMKENPGGS